MDKSKNSSPKEQMDIIIKNYLASNPVARMDGKENELEVRFGTNSRKHKPFTKIDYDNVVKDLIVAILTVRIVYVYFMNMLIKIAA